MTQQLATVQPQQPAQTVEAKDVIEFIPWGTEDKIKLSLAIVRETIAVPAHGRNEQGQSVELLPDRRECMKFMMLCRSRRLNPFEGDAFMVPFFNKQSQKYEWSLITAHNAYLKRAEVHPEYDGMQSGIILESESGQYIEIEGDFVPKYYEDQEAGEKQKVTLVGGWARVHFKQRKFPMYRRASLATFAQPFGQWVKNAAGMIVKVAEADALRSAFPTLLGGLYLKEEVEIQSEVVESRPAQTNERRPAFTRGLPAPNLSQNAATAKPAPTGQKPAQDAPKAKSAVQGQAPPAAPQAAASPTQGTPQESAVTSQTEPGNAPAGNETGNEQGETTTEAAGQEQQGQETTPETTEQTDEQAEAAAGLAPQPEDGAAPQEGAPVEPARAPQELLPRILTTDSAELKAVKLELVKSGVTEAQTMSVLRRKKIAKDGQKLADLATLKLQALVRNLPNFLADIRMQPLE